MNPAITRLKNLVKRVPPGLVGMLVFVVMIETYIGYHKYNYTNTATLSWSLSDNSAKSDARSAEVLCLGDSLVKHGMISEVLEEKLGKRVHNLSICASSAPATYYIYKHAIAHGSHPKLIIVDYMPDLLTGSPRHASPCWPEILNYGELVELSRAARDFGFFVLMARDRLLPSMRNRFEIQTNIVSALKGKVDPLYLTNLALSRNWAVHRGAEYTPDNPAFTGQVSEEDHYKLMSDTFWCNKVNRAYIHKFMDEAGKHGTKVYWLMPPVSPGIQERRVKSGADAKYTDFVKEVSSKHKHVTVIDARRSKFDYRQFVDPVHLNGRGGVALSTEVAEAIQAGKNEWVWLPRFRSRPSSLKLEDVDQSKMAVGASGSVYK